MKKILFVIFSLIFSLCLVGCNKVKSEEDKKMFNEYFSDIDSIEDYKKATYNLTFTKNETTYNYKYSCEYKEDGTIEIWKIINHQNIYYIYRFVDDKLMIEEYDTWPNLSDAQVIKVSEINVNKEEFLEQYEIVRNPKYHLDFKQSNYYRERVHMINDLDHWNHTFEFNKDYVYEVKLFDLDIELHNCIMSFTTFETENDPNSIINIHITGIYDNVLYKLYINIDK